MDDEKRRCSASPAPSPTSLNWHSLLTCDGDELETHYRHILTELGSGSGLIPTIFRKAQNKIQDPAKLRRLIDLIDGETWVGLDIDVKADIYEGLLEKNAQDTKSGAGQYFTPRPLIQAMVDVMQPQPGQTICDPACGTGGFLLAAYDYITRPHARPGPVAPPQPRRPPRLGDRRQHRPPLRHEPLPARHRPDSDDSPIHVDDSLAADPGERFDMVLTNPPFGKKSSVTFVTDAGRTQARVPDHRARRLLGLDQQQAAQLRAAHQDHPQGQRHGRRRRARQRALRGRRRRDRAPQAAQDDATCTPCCACPPASSTPRASRPTCSSSTASTGGETAQTKQLWIYDLRTNIHFTLKQNPLTRADLDEFVACYNPANRHERTATWSEDNPDGRWRAYTYDELLARDKVNLDIFWLRDESLEDTANLPDPDVIAAEIISDLEAALEQFRLVANDLEEGLNEDLDGGLDKIRTGEG